MPNLATQTEAERAAARSSAAVFDLSHRGQVELTGADAVAFLHNLCTNDIKNLKPGNACEFFLTDNKARVVAHGVAHRLLPAEPPVLWLDFDRGSAAKTVAHLNRFVVSEQVEIADRSGALALLHVCGPKAEAVLGERVPDSFLIDRLALPGFDLLCPRDASESLCNELVKKGAMAAGAEAFEILRIEAGVPVDDIDIGAERFVVETGRIKQAICYTKGCYLGQEPIVMARDRGHVNRMLLGLKMEGPNRWRPGPR